MHLERRDLYSEDRSESIRFAAMGLDPGLIRGSETIQWVPKRCSQFPQAWFSSWRTPFFRDGKPIGAGGLNAPCASPRSWGSPRSTARGERCSPRSTVRSKGRGTRMGRSRSGRRREGRSSRYALFPRPSSEAASGSPDRCSLSDGRSTRRPSPQPGRTRAFLPCTARSWTTWWWRYRCSPCPRGSPPTMPRGGARPWSSDGTD